MVRAAYSSGTPGLRRRRRQLDDDHRRDRRHRGSGAQHADLEDVRLRFGLLGRRQPDHRSVDLRPHARAAATGKAATLRTTRRRRRCAGVMWDDEGASHAEHRRHRRPSSSRRSPASRFPTTASSSSSSGDGIGKEHLFSSEKLTTLLAVYKYQDFDQALAHDAAPIYEVGGKGHSCGIYSLQRGPHPPARARGAGVADHGAAAAVEGERRARSTTACR